MTPDEALARGRVAFDARSFFAAHEHWEIAWRQAPAPTRAAYQGLIQLAAACYKLERGEFVPARNLLIRAVRAFESVPSLPDLDLPRLRGETQALLLRLEDLGPEGLHALEATCYPHLGPEHP